MKRIWEFYENMNELVYVSDMDSHEIVYMNRRALEAYGFQSLEEAAGRKCYEVLHGSSKQCAICNNGNLKPGYFEEWQCRNHVLGKMLALKDTKIEADGKNYRMELAIDMSVQEQQSKMLQDFANNEAMINEGLRISLDAATPQKSLEILMEYLGHSLNSERAYIFEETETGSYNNTYEWCAEGVVPQKDNLQEVPFEVVKLWYKKFLNNENVVIQDLESIRTEDPAVYEYLLPQDIHSLVVSPLFREKKIIGFYGVDNPPGGLLTHISMMFQIMGHFIVSLLKRRELVKKLTDLSLCDQMTEMGNRHAMNEYISAMRAENSIGIVYCDVMGLKKENDTRGHRAGDDLLLRASGCLKRAFGEYSLFRVGGDEFLVLCAGIEKEALLDRVELLKKDMREKAALMAIGCVWRPESGEDMDKLLAEADDLMYQDKREYYAGQQGL